MNTKDTIALWGCTICSTVQQATGTALGTFMAIVWLAFAGAIIYSSRRPASKERAR